MDLILWRHAEAEDGFNDSLRKLTPKGKKQAMKVAGWLELRLSPGYRLLSSPAVRAKQTAAALSPDFATDPRLDTGAGSMSVLDAAGWPDGEGTVIIVGHQPTLGLVAARVMTGRDQPWSLKKGAAWWFSTKSQGVDRETVLIAAITPDKV